MISDIGSFLKWFSGVNRRAVRDLAALPPEAETWQPPSGEGESSWNISQLVEHMITSRAFFTRAYLEGGWMYEGISKPLGVRSEWIDALNDSAAKLQQDLQETPDDFLQRRITLIDGQGSVSGWRVLMMMAEHEIHHRSQIDTYAGINGWNVEQIFGKRYEEVVNLGPARS